MKKGQIFMIMAALCFSLISTISKMITTLPLTEKLFIASLIGFILMLINNMYHKEKILGNKKLILFIRGILGVIGLFLYHFSISKMNLADATVLYKMTPIFVLIITTIIFKEKADKNLVIAIILVFVGTILVVKPTLNVNLLPVASCILASIVTAVAYLTVDYLKESEKTATMVLYYVFCSAFFMLPGAGTGTWVAPSSMEVLLLILMGIITLLAQVCMNHSYRVSENVNDVTIFLYGEILFSFIIGILVFKEGFDISSILGAILMIAAVIIISPKEEVTMDA